jgi:predicted amidohydrolase YtcJ
MPNLILTNANVITMNPALAHAELVAIRDGKILSIGKNKDLHKLRKKRTEVIDFKGKTILPGFIDAHCHLLAFAESLVALNLKPQNAIHSISDIQAAIRQLACDLAPGTWIK